MKGRELTLVDEQALRPLASEQVIVEAPFSFTGSYRRIRALGERHPQATTGRQAALAVGLVSLLVLAWMGVALWYCSFGLLLVPYRLVRRSQRERVRAELRHREQLEAR
jgi:hypothetical protein